MIDSERRTCRQRASKCLEDWPPNMLGPRADDDFAPIPPSLAVRTYFLGPFALYSELEIPELRGVRGTGQIAVRIELGRVPRELAETRVYDALCSVGPEDYLLHIPGVARFHAAHGDHVRVELLPGAARSEISTFLLGSVFGALCHQNSLLPLHASSIAAGGGVTAFLGASGAGKSTLAACLQARGHRIFSDDICLLEEDGAEVRAVRVAGWLKLWRQSLELLGMRPEDKDRVFAKEDKFRMYLHGEEAERLPLRAVVFLARVAPGEMPRLLPLPAAETIAQMMELTYLPYIPALNGMEVALFQQCGRALRGARGYRLEVPSELSRMVEVVEVLEGELLGKGS